MQAGVPSSPANQPVAAASPAGDRLLKARISNDCVRSWPYSKLPKNLGVGLSKGMWPLNQAPRPLGDALLLLISTSQSCAPDLHALGGPFDVIAAQLLLVGHTGVRATPLINLASTLELLKVLPKMPPALRTSLLATSPHAEPTIQLSEPEEFVLEFAILVDNNGGATPDPHGPDALLKHLGLGPTVSLGVLFVTQQDANDEAAGAMKGAKGEPHLLSAQQAAGGCLQLRRYNAGTTVRHPTFASTV
jgi:hypothetical protein